MYEWRIENKYSRWYDALMMRACLRQLQKPYERHHVWPKALGGKSSGIVCLTHREHFLAHWLLTKFTTGQNQHKMLKALVCMSDLKRGERIVSSWQYELAKRTASMIWNDLEFRAIQSEKLGEQSKKAWQDPDYHARQVENRKREQGTLEARAANAERAKDRWQDPEFQEIMSRPRPDMLGDLNPSVRPEVRIILSQQKLGDLNPAKREDVRNKIGTSVKKFNIAHPEVNAANPRFRGGKHKTETKQAMSLARQGVNSANAKLTDEIVREIRALEGTMKRPAIAELFGLNVWHVRDIQKRRCWKHVL